MMFIPDILTIFANITLIDLYTYDRIFVPPAWTLTIEFYFYILIGIVPLGLKRSLAGFGVALILLIYFIKFPPETRHITLLTGLYGFSIGAVLHYASTFYKHNLAITTQLIIIAALASILPSLFYILTAIGIQASNQILTLIGGFFGAIFLYILLPYGKHNISPALWRIDRKLGDLAYGVFLVHYPVGMCVLYLGKKIFPFFGLLPMERFSFSFFVMSVVASVTVSFFMHKYVEAAINRIRDHIRGSAAFGV